MRLPARVESAFQTAKTTTSATRERLDQVAAHPRSASLIRNLLGLLKQLAAFAFAFAIVLVILWVWAKAQSVEENRPELRLWGEVAFFGVVIWWGIATASQGISWMTRQKIPSVSIVQSLVWAGVVVLAVPVAVDLRIVGGAVLISMVLVFAVLSAVACRTFERFPRVPLTVSAAIGSTFLFFVAIARPIPVIEFDRWTAPPPVAEIGDLARDLRPALFLDDAERYQPVDLGKADISGCQEKLRDESCEDVKAEEDLDKWDYLQVTGTKLRPGEQPSGPIYYHAVEDDRRLYLDYWWYFAHNPSPFGGDVACADAFGWLGDACQEHPADWEGITIALVRAECDPAREPFSCVAARIANDDRNYEIVAAHYAQHDKVIVYPWETLQIEWQAPAMQRFRRNAGARPLVFPARDGHASYALPCPRPQVPKCNQIVHPRAKERRNGGSEWANNDDMICARDCVQPLPIDAEGKATGWNAFPGRWGAQHCILFGTYCDLQPAPKAPSFQKRYREQCPGEGHCLTTGKF